MDCETIMTVVLEGLAKDPNAARVGCALVVLNGAVTAEGHNGANASVDLAFKVADAFILKATAALNAPKVEKIEPK